MSALAPGARCALHPEVGAIDVCQRCGNFVCPTCVEVTEADIFCTTCAPLLAKPVSGRLKVVLALSVGWIPMVLVAQALVPTTVAPRWAWWALTPFELAPLTLAWIQEVRARHQSRATRGGWMVGVSAVALGLQLLVVLGIASLMRRH